MNLKKISIIIAFIITDIAVYIFLALLLMGYDDFYDESKGVYWSLASMNLFEKTVYISLIIWNTINWIIGGLIIFKIINFFLNKYINF
jgi:hypothetical protein